MNITTDSAPFNVLAPSDITVGSLPTNVPTITTPATNANGGVIITGTQNVDNNLLLVPFGTTTSGNTFTMRVWGWKLVGASTLWIPVLLAEFAGVLGTTAGVPGQTPDANHLLATTLTLTTGNQNVDVSLLSPGSNLTAWCMIDIKGFNRVEVDLAKGSATAMNALYVLL